MKKVFQKDSITDKRFAFAINVTMKYLYNFVISVTTYYVFQSMSMTLSPPVKYFTDRSKAVLLLWTP